MKRFILLIAVLVASFRSAHLKTLADDDAIINNTSILKSRSFRNIGSRAVCSNNYSPCKCNVDVNGVNVLCVDVAIADVKTAFSRTTDPTIYKFEYYKTSASSDSLPADVFHDRNVTQIHIGCPKTDGTCQTLTLASIDDAAFRFTRRSTTALHLKFVDFSSVLNFNFLNGFEALKTLNIDNYLGLGAFEFLPQLPSLKSLSLTNGDISLAGISFPNVTPATLQSVDLSNNNLFESTISNKILMSLSASSSADSIEYLNLSNNALGRYIPKLLPTSFSKLKSLDMNGNKIRMALVSRLNFTAAPTKLDLSKNVLTYIEDGAFYGDFSNAEIQLSENKLANFTEGAFKKVLQQMVTANLGGFVNISSNDIVCDCGLAWLLRDNRHLIRAVKGGICCNFIRYEDTGENSFNFCP